MKLFCLRIDTSKGVWIPTEVDRVLVEAFADAKKLYAVVLDDIAKLPDDQRHFIEFLWDGLEKYCMVFNKGITNTRNL